MHESVRRRPALRAAAHYLAISFEPPEVVSGFSSELHGELFRLCSDPERRAYSAFGLPRIPTRRLFGRRTAAAYARAALHGRWAFGKGSDVHQMGGDFGLDSDGIVRFAHVSREPGDRPRVGSLFAALFGSER